MKNGQQRQDASAPTGIFWIKRQRISSHVFPPHTLKPYNGGLNHYHILDKSHFRQRYLSDPTEARKKIALGI